MASLSNKVFAITGGASGMGLATGLRLARANVRAICIGDFNAQTLDGARDQILAANSKTEVLTTKIDVSSSSSVQGWINDIIEKFGTLDGAVNCAGVAQKVMARKSPTILEETDETWERTIGVNLNGVFFSTRAEVQAMVKLDKAPRSIVNIASMASMVHGPDCYAYGVSKRAVASLSTSVSKDVLPFGIRVNTVSPSATNTPMLSQFFDASAATSGDTMGFDLVSPEHIAEVITWLLSENSSKVSGANIPVGASAP
ncbi:hypothetical protein H2198_001563 [Neophaeococcomyces mojaviensis]|uniref:Uncharacterized protein n=1 Tax=Neophaeococcomyces mojaviensis TaxID=3383035 RepID=A0ACC3AHB4_9EURO|nr:hypothetical protein H2198_001563 [Knufia sp. JES_112]